MKQSKPGEVYHCLYTLASNICQTLAKNLRKINPKTHYEAADRHMLEEEER